MTMNTPAPALLGLSLPAINRVGGWKTGIGRSVFYLLSLFIVVVLLSLLFIYFFIYLFILLLLATHYLRPKQLPCGIESSRPSSGTAAK